MTAQTASILRLAARTWASYPIPLLLLAALALAPWLLVALQLPQPAHPAGAQAALRLAWLIGGTAWIGQLLLVGAAAPLARALATGARLTQRAALGRGARQLARAALPWLAAVAAILIGGLALALPGLALLCLFSTVPASTLPGLTAPLADSAATVRRAAPLVAATLAILLAIDLLIVFAILPPLPRKPLPAQLAGYHVRVRTIAIALAALAPCAAAVLAAIHARLASEPASVSPPGPR